MARLSSVFTICMILCMTISSGLWAQVEEIPASQEMIEDVPEEMEEPPAAKKADAYSGATALVLDPATVLYDGLKTNGHVVLEGIYFNNSNTLTIESDSCLEVISKMLQEHASLNIYIVGHTDNSAGVLAGMIKSQKRAEAVMNSLSNRFGIDLDRLFASGVGPLCPITSNATEEGRKQNNRIELVIQ